MQNVVFMPNWITPERFQQIALFFIDYQWRLLGCSLLSFVLFALLKLQIISTTPDMLVWLAIFILFFALQNLVLAAFIIFFQQLPSSKANDKQWFTLYRTVEWCETLLFAFLLPLPAMIFCYALILAFK